MQQHLELSDGELGETLQRAREIAGHSREPDARQGGYEGYLKAAEEVGIPREAVLQALYERLLIPAERYAPGQRVFAPSADGFWYLAEITGLGQHTATVRFLSAGESTCALADLRPASLIPGRKLQADCKGWGWWDAHIK